MTRLRRDRLDRPEPVARPPRVGRARARALAGCAAAAALVGAGYAATRSPLLDVDVVRVEGAVRTARSDVTRAGGLDARPQLADVDPASVAARIERLPWVQSAAVTRHWPATVEVSLRERSPVAAFAGPDPAGGEGRAWAVVDGSGRVLDHVGQVPDGMVTVEGPGPLPAPGEVVPEGSRGVLGVIEALSPALAERVAGVRLADDGGLELRLAPGPLVRFGPAERVPAKLVALETLLARVNVRGIRAIDVRVPTAPVLTRS